MSHNHSLLRRRLVSLLLALAVMTSFCIPGAFAEEPFEALEELIPEELILTEDWEEIPAAPEEGADLPEEPASEELPGAITPDALPAEELLLEELSMEELMAFDNIIITPQPSTGSRSLVEQFVERCYNLMMYRASDPGGLQYWTDNLLNGLLTGVQTVTYFSDSEEFTGKVRRGELTTPDVVTVLYRTMMNRYPDAEGLNFWVNALNTGVYSLHFIISEFGRSAEFISICATYGINPGSGGVTPPAPTPTTTPVYTGAKAFIQHCYVNALRRQPSEAEINSWVNNLNSMSPAQIILALLQSGEGQAVSNGLANAEYVARLFLLYTGREGKNNEIIAWQNELSSGRYSRLGVATYFGNTAESQNYIKNTYGLNPGSGGGGGGSSSVYPEASASYRSGPYYSKLASVNYSDSSLRNKLVNVALSQVGYHAGGYGDYSGQGTSGSYTEYGRYLDTYYGTHINGYPWCAIFATWCLKLAGVPSNILSTSTSSNAMEYTNGTSAKVYYFGQTVYGGGSYTPRRGDILLWSSSPRSFTPSDTLDHTSILVQNPSQNGNVVTFVTVGGNEQGGQVSHVARQVYASNGYPADYWGQYLCLIISPSCN